MADPLDELLRRAQQGPGGMPSVPQAPVETQSDDPLDRMLERAQKGAAPQTSADPLDDMIVKAGGTPTPPIDQEIENEFGSISGVEPQVQAPKQQRTGFAETLLNSIERGGRGVAASIPRLQGVYAEATGDGAGAGEFEAQARAIEEAGPQAQVPSLKDVSDLGTFVTWATERVGEQVPVLGSILIPGVGGGALVSNLVARGLLSSTAARALLTRWGAGGGAAAVGTGLETADTAEQQRQITGSYQPGISLTAGAAKGALEAIVPMGVARALMGGKQFARSIPGAIGKGAMLEGATEAAQNEVDLYARKYSDPNFDYFGSEANWSRIDSTAAGALVGSGFAGVGQAATGGKGPSGDTPGSQRTWTASDQDKEDRPVNWLWGKFFGKSGKPLDEDRTLREVLATDPTLDPTNARDLIHQIGPAWVKAGARLPQRDAIAEYIEANTERYLVPGRGQELLNATDAEGALAQLPMQLKPKILKVNQGSISPAGITARLNDLPQDGNDPRIFFLPGTKENEQQALRAEYTASKHLWGAYQESSLMEDPLQLLQGYGAETAKKAYGSLLNRGLRVLPSRGASFNYTLDVQGEEVSAPKSKRSILVGHMEFGKVKSLHKPENASDGGLLTQLLGPREKRDRVAVDMDRVKETDIIPTYYGAWDWVALPENTYQKWKAKHAEALAKSKADYEARSVIGTHYEGPIMDAFWQEVNKSGEVKRKANIEWHRYLIAEGVDIKSVLVPGVGNPSAFSQSQSYMDKQKPFLETAAQMTPTETVMEPLPPDATPEMKKTFSQLQEVMPWIKATEKTLKITPLTWRVTPKTNEYAGMYHTDTASISISAGHTFDYLLNVVFHELGHHVTISWWQKLEPEMKDLIWQGYQRNLVAFRYNKEAAARFTGWVQQTPVNGWYFQTFVEYLAEQFRRWSTTDVTPVGHLEKHFKDGITILERYIKEAEKLHGPELSRDLFHPDYTFAAWMSYIQNKSAQALRGRYKNYWKLFPSMSEATGNATLMEMTSMLEQTVIEMMPLMPKGWRLQVGETGRFNDERANIAVTIPTQKAVVIGLGALEYGAKGVIAHEAVHASEHLFTDQEWAELVREAKKDTVLINEINKVYTETYRANLTKYVQDNKLDMQEVEPALQKMLESEYVAFMIQAHANGKPRPEGIQALINRLLEFFRRVYQKMMGRGWVNAEALMDEFMRGEIAQRDFSEYMDEYRVQSMSWNYRDLVHATGANTLMIPDKVVEAWPGVSVAAELDKHPNGRLIANYTFFEGTSQNEDPRAAMQELGAALGQVLITSNAKGYEVDSVEVARNRRREGIAGKMYEFIEKDLNTKMKPSGILSPSGYKMWKARDANLIRYHVQSAGDTFFYSPNYISSRLNYYKKLHERWKNEPKIRELHDEKYLKTAIKDWEALRKRVNPKAWSDPELENMFHLSRMGRVSSIWMNILKQDRAHNEGEMLESIGMEGPQTAETGFNLEPGDVPSDEVAKRMPENINVRNLAKNLNYSAVQMPLVQNLAHNDRISWWSRWFLGLHQIVWRNPKITRLRQHLGLVERMNTEQMKWISMGDNTVRLWDKLKPSAQKGALAEMFFWATEMNYRTPQEVLNKVVRLPTQQEISDYVRTNGISQEAFGIYQRVMSEFDQALTKTEEISRLHILQRTAPNSPERTRAENQLVAEMKRLRARPYFPMVRFGEWTVTTRDSQTGAVTAFYSFATQRERNAHAADIQRSHPLDEVQVGRMHDSVKEFMGLSPTLLDLIKTLPGITQDQIKWIDQMALAHAPERSFRKRWLERKGTEGYSRDAMRAYSHYFNSFGNYISKLQYKPMLEANIAGFEEENKQLQDMTKRQEMVKFLKDHLDYVMKPSRDWMHIRAATTMWYLGFSPMAAGMNITQLPVVTMPYLINQFGYGQAFGAFRNLTKGAKRMLPGQSAVSPKYPGFTFAYEEAVRQGKIDTGQASELASFAEDDNLVAASAGTKTQRALRRFGHMSMWMFAKAEQYNREVTFGTAFELAMQQPRNPHVLEIGRDFAIEIAELMASAQAAGQPLNAQEATAFFVAKEALDRTQFIFAPYARPQISRNPIMANILVFTQFLQGMMFAMFQNPGKGKIWLVMLFMYGLMGLPGAEDLTELIKAVGRRLFGKDWDIEKEVRELALAAAQGTVFDQAAPDLLLHGISRYGFGTHLLIDVKGSPLFDASMNGSMGKTIPGAAELLKAWGTSQDFGHIHTKVTQDLAGAGYGYAMTLMKFLTGEPFSSDIKGWEKVMPRALKAASRAIRYARTGKETFPSGGTFAEFDWKDPEDAATLIAQFLGATPHRISAKWDAISARKEFVDFQKARKAILLKQVDEALQDGSQEAIETVFAKIQRYNAELEAQGLASMGISRKSLNSVRQRIRQRILDENNLPREKGQMPLYNEYERLYPNVQWKKKVK